MEQNFLHSRWKNDLLQGENIDQFGIEFSPKTFAWVKWIEATDRVLTPGLEFDSCVINRNG